MQVPVRLTFLLQPSVAPGVLVAVAYSTLVMVSTPFLLNLVAAHYAVSLTAASFVGVFQLGGFVAGSWGGGRWLQPRRRVFIAAMIASAVANLASSLLPVFPLLVGLRGVSGVSLGLLSWFAWVQVFGDDDGMADIAVIGPVAGIVAGPVVAVFAQRGIQELFLALGLAAIVPLAMNRGTGAAHKSLPSKTRSKPVPAALVILVALTLFTLGGSSVFQYVVVVGTGSIGLSASTIGLLFSMNAIAGIPGARWPWKRGIPSIWIGGTGLCAVILMNVSAAVLFGAVVVVWGFAFWMATPAVFSALADRSAHPADRAGDAQAVMALGRVIGPLIGGVVFDTLGPSAVGLIGGGLMFIAAITIFTVRQTAPPRTGV